MICPSCGSEIEEGNLYCGICGEEIHFVPVFEPEIEQSITDSLADLQFINDSNVNESEDNLVYIDSNGNYVDSFGNILDPSDVVLDDSIAETKEGAYSEAEDLYDDEFQDIAYDDESDDADADDAGYEDEYTEEYNEDEYVEDELEYIDDSYETDDEYTDGYDEVYDDDEEDEFLSDPFDDFEYESHLIKNFIKYISHSKAKWVYIFLIFALIVGLIVGTIVVAKNIRENHSAEYQYELALKADKVGDYEKAIECLEKCIKIDDSDDSKKFMLAQMYFKNGDDENGLRYLWEVIKDNSDCTKDAYEMLIKYYIKLEDYATICEILQSCNNVYVLEEYRNYLANAPVSSIEEGTYTDIISVDLSSDCGGTIYYTIDGSEPTTESNRYISPIVFDSPGQYTVSAVLVNEFGLVSDISKFSYLIDSITPKAPNILLDEGSYDIPLLIEVDVQKDCSVFYTTDGTTPADYETSSTYLYNGPIYMPIGNSHFTFVSYNIQGTASDVCMMDYNLNLKADIDMNEVITKLWAFDYLQGKTADLEGHLNMSSTQYNYSASSAITLNTDGTMLFLDHGTEGEEDIEDSEKVKELDKNTLEVYYVLVEYTIDVTGSISNTGTIYLVSAEDGTIFRAEKGENNAIRRLDALLPEEYTVNVTVSDNAAEVDMINN